MDMKEVGANIMDWCRTDRYNLEEEWERISERICIVSDLFVSFKNEADTAKWELDREEAEIYADVRANPGAYGIDKFTEKAAQMVTALQDSTKELSKEHIKIIGKAREVEGWLKALDVKRRALEYLVQLYSTQYFSEPKTKGATQEGIDKVRSRRTNRSVTEALNPKAGEE